MASYTLVVKPSGDGPIDHMIQRMENLEPLLDRLADDVLPLLARNYDASGLQVKAGVLKSAVSKRGAKGNYIVTSGSGLRIGVDYAALPYARWAIEGRGAVQATAKKALHFDAYGKSITVKSVRAAPPHPIFFLSAADLEQLSTDLTAMVEGKK